MKWILFEYNPILIIFIFWQISTRKKKTTDDSDQNNPRKVKIKNRKKKVKICKTSLEHKSYNEDSAKDSPTLSHYQHNPVQKPGASCLSVTNVTPPTQPTTSTLPRTGTTNEINPFKPTSLPRPPKLPRRPSGYISPAASLKRQTKTDIFKGLNLRKLENLPELLKNSVPKYPWNT